MVPGTTPTLPQADDAPLFDDVLPVAPQVAVRAARTAAPLTKNDSIARRRDTAPQ